MRYELNIYQADGVQTVSVEIGDIRNEGDWPVQTENPLSAYSILLPQVTVKRQGREAVAALEFDIRSFQILISFEEGSWNKALESLDVQQLRRQFLRTLLLKWREEGITETMSHDAAILYNNAQAEVRRLEGR